MFKSSLKMKILFSFVAILILMFTLSLFACWQLYNVDRLYGDLFMLRIEKIKGAYEMRTNTLNMAYAARGYLLYGTQEMFDDFHLYHKEAKDILDKLPATVKTEKGKQLLAQVTAAEADYYQKTAATIEAKRSKASEEEVNAKLSQAVVASKQLTVATKEFTDFQLERLQEDREDTSAKGHRAVIIIIAGCSAILIVSLLLAFIVAQMISNPLRLVDAGAARVAKGDLTGEEIIVRSQDEVGRLAKSFNYMLSSLKEIIGQLQDKAQALASATVQFSAGTEQITSSANETASSASEVSAAVDKITQNIQKIAGASNQAASYAKEGSGGIKDVTQQMAAIQNSTESVVAAIQGLNESSKKISQIVELISQIADQTNLLALNAAIEAARAGEHGRGFAVVADEVRKLAEQSAGAAKEIHDLINDIQQKTTETVKVMDEGAEQVSLGTTVVHHMGETFKKIIEKVQELATDIQDIASSAEQMSSAVQNVAAAAQEQTATMEEVSSTTQNLANIAQELETLARRFKLT